MVNLVSRIKEQGLVDDDMYGFEKIFYSNDEPFGTLDGHAKRLYEEAKEHFFDVPVANDMRKFIAGYLGKGGDA